LCSKNFQTKIWLHLAGKNMKLDKAPPTSSTSNTWRVGDWVEVRSLAEILETLDEQAALNAMPFMPEMAPYCGKRFRILKVSHKTCDSSGWYYLRTLRDSVHLDLRCDGSYHDGCQAGCLFFWKTAWLRKADGPLPDNRERAKREEGLFPETLKNSTCRGKRKRDQMLSLPSHRNQKRNRASETVATVAIHTRF
jgi:hypothetical protein